MAIGTPVDLGKATSASATSLTIASTLAAVAAGESILIFANMASGQTISSITATSGDTPFGTTAASAVPILNFAWFASSAGMAIASSITVNFGGGAARCAINAVKVSGMNPVTAVMRDARSVPATTTGTATSATSQTTNALSSVSTLLFGATGHGSADPGTWSPPAGFTAIGGTTSVCFLKLAWKIVTVPAPVVWNPTWVNSVTYRSSVQCFLGAQAANTSREMQQSMMGMGA